MATANNRTNWLNIPGQREAIYDPYLVDVFPSTYCAAGITATKNTTRFHPVPVARTNPSAIMPTIGMSNATSTNDRTFSPSRAAGYAPTRSLKLYPLPKFDGQNEERQASIEDFQTTTAEFHYNELHCIMRIRDALYGPVLEVVEPLLNSSKNINAILTTAAETYSRPK
ncbi:unnamed protein product [Ceratitis capitata]|uniref:(Mediterranean fruit fly) hypothetical protein n=1 Tax=Ceratitis capitata TaxID=7213 RepID=A0A811UA57_CERCA|nr:unnamed protein product [Ceratitis capitata]